MKMQHIQNMEVVGFMDGYEGLIENRYTALDDKAVSGILTRGGTILGTSNKADPFRFPILENDKWIYIDRSSQAIRNYERLGLDALVAIGGDGTMAATNGLQQLGMKAVGIPATRLAEELGKRQCTNTVMCGFFAAVSGVVSEKAMRESVKASVPERTVDLNLEAFDKGFAFGKNPEA